MSRTLFTEQEADRLQSEALANYDVIRLTFSDVHGRSLGKHIPSSGVKNAVLKGLTVTHGTQLYGAASEIVYDLSTADWRNAWLRPQIKFIYPVTWCNSKHRVGEMLCECEWRTGEPVDGDTRSIARRQVDRLSKMQYRLMSGFESEFIVFKSDHHERLFEERALYSNATIAQASDFLYDLMAHLPNKSPELGAGWYTFQAEYARSQFEYAFQPSEGIAPADQMFVFRDILKTVGAQCGHSINLLARPCATDIGSGLHFSTSLWDPKLKTNLFFDRSKDDLMSDLMKNWLAGLCAHAGALTAVCSPTVNCYRRHAAPGAPYRASWGIEDRSASYRVKTCSAKSALVENRLPSAMANPYLVLAATVAAGIDGLERQLQLPTEEEMNFLPKNLEEALQKLEADQVLVDALGAGFVQKFANTKRLGEIATLGYVDTKDKDDIEYYQKELEEYKTI